MKQVDLLIIGGSAGGILSANTARKVYKDKSIAVIREQKTVMVPCGIPYIYGTLNDTSKNIIPDKVITDNQVELIIDKVAVSYTHLTLPTILLVQISVVAVSLKKKKNIMSSQRYRDSKN
eukprot:TRINITY_DN8522_c0_g1_i1.p2 TRINITY_DN8522_c0_g1~~TRINITY_DN8522_c0_g1_i1.p2  ORF type:complete len:120 (-),score=24.09 TRINITY_DN8522_c0_g1_i1:59-418(-)